MGDRSLGHQRSGVPRDRPVFVGLHHADGHWTAGGGDDRRVRRVAPRVQVDAEKRQTVADALADRGGMLADPGGEDEGVEPAQDGGQERCQA
jgi:hypothetical protein